LNASSGVSMITVPVDDPLRPSKVFVIEVSQPIRNKKGKVDASVGVLVYSVDAKLASGQNAVVVYPKTDTLNAPFQAGDRFEHKDAPVRMKVLKKNEDGSYFIEVKLVSRSAPQAGPPESRQILNCGP
jgi:hypothetical protein